MSDFPSPETYKTNISNSHLKNLSNFGVKSIYPFVIKKEKNQYLYDIDGNKYVDFFLNNGSVIAGHNHKSLSLYIKNAISLSTESVFINKFYNRLVKYFKSITDVENIQFYQSQTEAMYELLKKVRPSSVAVNSSFLFNFFKEFFRDIEIYLVPHSKKFFDLFVFEPIDFDNQLEPFDFKKIKAKKYCVFESRTAFRISYGFSQTIENVDFIFCGDIISNGMSSCVIISRENIPQRIIPSFLTLHILETLKYYKRKNVHLSFLNLQNNSVIFQRGGIFKLKKNVDARKLLPYGIFIKDDVLFLSIMHTENDIKRLKNVLLYN